ncbi:MAG: hypothetical protein QNJ31_08315 [Candidatus Caenarcaniphilales bacterium]|nr:hypothetical protein [Candidatus Caenarcaniphilales bacterium]
MSTNSPISLPSIPQTSSAVIQKKTNTVESTLQILQGDKIDKNQVVYDVFPTLVTGPVLDPLREYLQSAAFEESLVDFSRRVPKINNIRNLSSELAIAMLSNNSYVTEDNLKKILEFIDNHNGEDTILQMLKKNLETKHPFFEFQQTILEILKQGNIQLDNINSLDDLVNNLLQIKKTIGLTKEQINDSIINSGVNFSSMLNGILNNERPSLLNEKEREVPSLFYFSKAGKAGQAVGRPEWLNNALDSLISGKIPSISSGEGSDIYKSVKERVQKRIGKLNSGSDSDFLDGIPDIKQRPKDSNLLALGQICLIKYQQALDTSNYERALEYGLLVFLLNNGNKLVDKLYSAKGNSNLQQKMGLQDSEVNALGLIDLSGVDSNNVSKIKELTKKFKDIQEKYKKDIAKAAEDSGLKDGLSGPLGQLFNIRSENPFHSISIYRIQRTKVNAAQVLINNSVADIANKGGLTTLNGENVKKGDVEVSLILPQLSQFLTVFVEMEIGRLKQQSEFGEAEIKRATDQIGKTAQFFNG